MCASACVCVECVCLPVCVCVVFVCAVYSALPGAKFLIRQVQHVSPLMRPCKLSPPINSVVI